MASASQPASSARRTDASLIRNTVAWPRDSTSASRRRLRATEATSGPGATTVRSAWISTWSTSTGSASDRAAATRCACARRAAGRRGVRVEQQAGRRAEGARAEQPEVGALAQGRGDRQLPQLAGPPRLPVVEDREDPLLGQRGADGQAREQADDVAAQHRDRPAVAVGGEQLGLLVGQRREPGQRQPGVDEVDPLLGGRLRHPGVEVVGGDPVRVTPRCRPPPVGRRRRPRSSGRCAPSRRADGPAPRRSRGATGLRCAGCPAGAPTSRRAGRAPGPAPRVRAGPPGRRRRRPRAPRPGRRRAGATRAPGRAATSSRTGTIARSPCGRSPQQGEVDQVVQRGPAVGGGLGRQRRRGRGDQLVGGPRRVDRQLRCDAQDVQVHRVEAVQAPGHCRTGGGPCGQRREVRGHGVDEVGPPAQQAAPAQRRRAGAGRRRDSGGRPSDLRYAVAGRGDRASARAAAAGPHDEPDEHDDEPDAGQHREEPHRPGQLEGRDEQGQHRDER